MWNSTNRPHIKPIEVIRESACRLLSSGMLALGLGLKGNIFGLGLGLATQGLGLGLATQGFGLGLELET